MSQEFGFEVEKRNDTYVFTDNPEMCPDCGDETVVPINWEKIKAGYWQVDRFCYNCCESVNSTFLNEQQIYEYHEKFPKILSRVAMD